MESDTALAGAVVIDVEALYRGDGGTARQADLPRYEAAARQQAGEGKDVVLTGRGPIWLYLRLAHVLHGTVRTLTYRAPEAGDVLIFDHISR
jgi:CRISPR-associated Csx3 family protein